VNALVLNLSKKMSQKVNILVFNLGKKDEQYRLGVVE